MTDDGKMFFNLASNAIANGIKSSLKKTPLPSIEELFCGENEKNKALFQSLKRNGDNMWERIKKDVKIILTRTNQKSR